MSLDRQSTWEPGDVLDYTPRNRWCYEGIAIVNEAGRAVDTYWSHQPNALTAEELATARLRFRLEDVREVGSEDEWLTYAPSDRHTISSQHGHQWTHYVRRDAGPDLDTQIENARQAVADAESAVSHAEWRLECRREDLANLEAARV